MLLWKYKISLPYVLRRIKLRTTWKINFNSHFATTCSVTYYSVTITWNCILNISGKKTKQNQNNRNKQKKNQPNQPPTKQKNTKPHKHNATPTPYRNKATSQAEWILSSQGHTRKSHNHMYLSIKSLKIKSIKPLWLTKAYVYYKGKIPKLIKTEKIPGA